MRRLNAPGFLSRLLAEHGMLPILLGLCAYFSYATWTAQHATGAAAGAQVADEVVRRYGASARVLIVVRDRPEDAVFAAALARRLREAGVTRVEAARGDPSDARRLLQTIAAAGGKLDAVAADETAGSWPVLQDLGRKYPTLGDVPVLTPHGYRGSNFLKAENLLNIASQIAVIAVIAIGMTMVIITGGIDLSVGRLIALSAVVATLLIRDWAGAESATAAGMVLCGAAAVGLCGLVGLLSGALITVFRLPPFIVTLATMRIAGGLALLLSEGQSIYQVPDSFTWLGSGADLVGIPNAVVLMAGLYLVAHVVMTRTALGRYVYAVGGNVEAARLSGVPVPRIILLVYTVSGLLAGLGGVVLASKLKSGSPTYGQMYELDVIAAVVLGGTSLSGGEGRIFGTLVGAFFIAVIQNGMNITGVGSYKQEVVLGAVILAAVLLDQLKKPGWAWPRWLSRPAAGAAVEKGK